MVIISHCIIKSKSWQILDVYCEPKEIGHLEVAILRVAKNDVSYDEQIQQYLHYT